MVNFETIRRHAMVVIVLIISANTIEFNPTALLRPRPSVAIALGSLN
jgi:hypothetical protein